MTPDEFRALPENFPHRVVFRSRNFENQASGWLTIKNGSGAVRYDDQTIANISQNCVDSTAAWLSMLHLVTTASGDRTVEIKISATIPSGYEATGEFRQPDPTVDTYIHQDGVTVVHPAPRGNGMPKGPRIILRKNQTAKERLQALCVTASSLPTIRMEIEEILKLI